MVLIDSVAFRNILIDRQLNAKDLADMATIPTATVSHIAKFDKKVTFKTIGKICKALKIDPDTIIKSEKE